MKQNTPRISSDNSVIREFDNKNWVHPWEALDAIGTQNRTIAGSGQGIYLVNENNEKLSIYKQKNGNLFFKSLRQSIL